MSWPITVVPLRNSTLVTLPPGSLAVAVIVDRNTGAQQAVEAAGLEYRWAISASDLGLQ